MEFGKLPQIDHVDWTLPPNDPLSVQYLQTFAGGREIEIFIGAPAWGHKEWVGLIYPEKTKSTEFLYWYSRFFSCVELNTSHYRIPSEEQTQKWLEQVPPHFLFCPKIFNGISHSPHGLKDQPLLQEWWNFLARLENQNGPCFLQLPPTFNYHLKSELFQFLQNWPLEFPLCLEFRHPSWFQDGKILPALTEYLQRRGIGLVITDVAGRRDVLHTSISSEFVFLRFISNNLHASDFERAKSWSQRFAEWESLGLQKIFLIIHEPDDLSAPQMTEAFIEEMNRAGGWHLKAERPAPKTTPQMSWELGV